MEALELHTTKRVARVIQPRIEKGREVQTEKWTEERARHNLEEAEVVMVTVLTLLLFSFFFPSQPFIDHHSLKVPCLSTLIIQTGKK